MEGINSGVLIGQIINFAILFFVLTYFVYKPFLNLLKKRRNLIESGVKKTEEAEKRILEIEKLKEDAARKAEEERKALLIKAENEAKGRADSIMKSAEEDRVVLIQKAEKECDALREKTKEKVRESVVENAFELAEKLLKENIDHEKNKKITSEFLNKLKV
jgi:F-type H+-transporting ATPase subunit b